MTDASPATEAVAETISVARVHVFGPGLGFALLLSTLLLAGCEEGLDEAPPPPRVPSLGALNAHVLATMATYPTDGTHGYWWPKTGAWIGNARDLSYDGRLFAKGDPEGRCHCSGLTFEVFLQAWERWCESVGRPYRILDYGPAELRAFQRAWFGTSGDRATLHTALTERSLGVRIADWEQARAGDFVQLWRQSGSGHSLIFRAWVRDADGKIVGLRYWSTQSTTKGIGEREERFGASGSSVKRDEFYLVRVGR